MELYIYLPTCYKVFVETYIPYSENNINRQINPRKAIKNTTQLQNLIKELWKLAKIHEISISWFGPGTSIKCGGAKQVL
jgi:hypothetical protein